MNGKSQQCSDLGFPRVRKNDRRTDVTFHFPSFIIFVNILKYCFRLKLLAVILIVSCDEEKVLQKEY